jgi:hypothetical protein|tara:strand:+ start:2872 stop:3435 length:564 start_codon:yes stop_codon:yes gene_type:complete
MEKYYEYLNRYYREINSGKKCKGCTSLKDFSSSNGELSFTCGGNGECSDSFKIKLSKYINYMTTLYEFYRFTNKEHNISNKERAEIITGLEGILKSGKKQVAENNNVSSKKLIITEYDNIKIKTKIEQTKLLSDINNPSYSGSVDKDDLLKRYHSLNKMLNEKYKELADLCETPINNYVIVNKGSVH